MQNTLNNDKKKTRKDFTCDNLMNVNGDDFFLSNYDENLFPSFIRIFFLSLQETHTILLTFLTPIPPQKHKQG